MLSNSNSSCASSSSCAVSSSSDSDSSISVASTVPSEVGDVADDCTTLLLLDSVRYTRRKVAVSGVGRAVQKMTQGGPFGSRSLRSEMETGTVNDLRSNEQEPRVLLGLLDTAALFIMLAIAFFLIACLAKIADSSRADSVAMCGVFMLGAGGTFFVLAILGATTPASRLLSAVESFVYSQ